MANLLTNANLQALVSIDESETVSLTTLLLSEEEQEQLIITRQAQIATTKQSRPTRSDRLSRTKSAKTSQKGQLHAPIQQSEQLRKSQKIEEKFRQNLESYQLQLGKKEKGTIDSSLRLDQFRNTSETIASTHQNSIKVQSALRPVILGMLDFMPLLDSTGASATASGNIVKINRAIRVLNAENLPAELISTDRTSWKTDSLENIELDFLNEYTQYVNQTITFLSALDIENFSVLEDALSFLAIDNESSVAASNTQLLLSILRDYAIAVENCSPRLFEAEEREIPGVGSALAEPVAGLESLRAVLKSSDAFDYLDAVLGDDAERALKILLYQISSELKLSYNASKYGIATPAGSTLQAPRNASSIIPSGQTNQNFFGLRKLTIDPIKGQTFLFPMEQRDILPDDSAIVFDSAPDILARNISKDPTDVYGEIASSAKDKFSAIAASLDTGDFSSDYAPSIGGFILILQNVALPLLESLIESKTPSRRTIVEFLILSEAGKNSDMLAQLMLFLAALKEEMARPATSTNLKVGQRAKVVGSLAQSSRAKFSGLQAPTVVRSTSHSVSTVAASTSKMTKVNAFAPLKAIGSVGLKMMTTKAPSSLKSVSTITSTTANAGTDLIAAVKSSKVIATVATKDFKVFTTPITNTNVSTPTTTTSSLTAGFIEICEQTAALLLKLLTDVSGTSLSSSSSSVSLTEKTVASALKAIVTTDDSSDVFIAMLTIFDDFTEMFASSDGSCFSAQSITNYSGMSRGNIEIAFFMCIAKMHSFLSKDAYKASSNITKSTSIDITMDAEYLTSLSEGLVDAFSDDIDIDDLTSIAPSLGRIVDSLAEEEAFVATLPAAFSEYLDNISESFSAVKEALSTDTDDASGSTVTLNDKINDGLPVSRDLAMSLMSLVSFYNSDALLFSSFKSLDMSLSDTAMMFFSKAMEKIDFLENKKIAAIAIPSGLCDSVYNVPISLEDISRSGATLSKDTFEIVIDKIDLTRPGLTFEEKVFSFSRNLFLNSFTQSSETVVDPNFSSFNESLEESTISESDLVSTTSSDLLYEKVENLKNDAALKMYLSLLYDLDFSITNYPASVEEATFLKDQYSIINMAKSLDTESNDFLSGSNLAFDKLQRTMASFEWFDQTTGTLSFGTQFNSDTTAYSVWEYLSAIGVVAYGKAVEEKMKLGSRFERVLLIPFDPYDFSVKQQTFGEDYATENIVNENLTLAEQEVGIGLESSQGVELATFRITIRIPEETIDEQ